MFVNPQIKIWTDINTRTIITTISTKITYITGFIYIKVKSELLVRTLHVDVVVKN